MHENGLSTSPEDLAAINESNQAEKHGCLDEEDRASVASHQRHDLLGESIPKTFQTREEEVTEEQAPVPHAEWGDMNVDDRKRAFFEGNPNSVVKETVKGFAEEFEVPEDFIGDFLCRHGADPPIPLDVPLCNLVDTATLWNLTEYLQLQDAARIQDMYPPESIEQIASDFNCPVQKVLHACTALSIKLPFAEKSRLNSECYNAVTKRLAKQTYAPPSSHLC